MKLKLEGGTTRVFGIRGGSQSPYIGYHMLFLRRLIVQMSRCDFKSEDIFFKEVLFYKLLHIHPKGLAMDGLVTIAFVVGAIFL